MHRFFIIVGIIFIAIGLLVFILDKFSLPQLGNLPGDIKIRKDNFHFYLPITSCIIVSIVVSLLSMLFFHIKR